MITHAGPRNIMNVDEREAEGHHGYVALCFDHFEGALHKGGWRFTAFVLVLTSSNTI